MCSSDLSILFAKVLSRPILFILCPHWVFPKSFLSRTALLEKSGGARRFLADAWGAINRRNQLALLMVVFSIAFTPSLVFADAAILGVATGAQQKTKDSSGASVNTDGLLGYGVGVLKEFRSKAAPVGYEFGVFYLQRKPGRYGSYSESSNWISVPFLARRHLGRFSGGLGAYVAHGYGNVTTERGGVKTVAPLSETLNDLDFGPQFGFGFKIYKDVWVINIVNVN